MQLKTYLQILLKRWWIVAASFGIVVLGTYIWTSNQGPVYQSKTTYILKPRSAINQLDEDFVRSLEMVSRRVEINTTFAEVASSKLIKSQALDETDYSQSVREKLSVSAVVLGGTNILEITVEGPKPEIAQEYCTLVGLKTHEYVASLYDVFELQLLDAASKRETPVRPNLLFNLLLGSFLALGLGVGLTFLVEFIVSPYTEPNTFNIIDRETGAYNKAYLVHRLRQEINRAKRHDYPVSLGLIKIDIEGEGITDQDKSETMRLFKIIIENEMRDEDLIATIDKEIFAFMYPYLNTNNARTIINNVQKKFDSMVHDVTSMNGNLYYSSYSTVVGFSANDSTETQFLDRGIRALRTKQD
jgi:capsular polysaccharide biosynthesis protein